MLNENPSDLDKYESPPIKKSNAFDQLQSPSFQEQDLANQEIIELDQQISKAQKDKNMPQNILRQNTFGVSSEADHPIQKIQKISSGSIDFQENKENAFQSPTASTKKTREHPVTQSDRRMDSVFTFHLSEPYTNQSEQEVSFRQIKQLIGTKNKYLNWEDMIFDSRVVDEMLDRYLGEANLGKDKKD